MTRVIVMQRPARIASDEGSLDREFRAARWAHHRLLDFEDEHQDVLDAAAEECAPGIVRVGRILARLARRAKRRERSSPGTWSPSPRVVLAAELKVRLADMRKQRNADPRWKAAMAWADDEVGDPKKPRRRRAKHPSRVKRRKTESDEAWAARFARETTDETDEHFAAKLANPPRDTRRDIERKRIYAERRCSASTWNGVIKSVDQARAAVLSARKEGRPADWRRPRWSDACTIFAEPKHFRIVDRGPLWWTIEMRISPGVEWVRFRAKCGNWHDTTGAKFLGAKLTRRRDGMRWVYSVSITVEMPAGDPVHATRGVVALDWGHREHGHDRASEGLRVFTWRGDDGQAGEVLLPIACRRAQDEIDAIKARLDEAFNARQASMGLADRNRFTYRRRLLALGVRTAEESDWLRWEMRQERRLMARRKRIDNVRKEAYRAAVRHLRRHYATFAFEDESVAGLKRAQKDEQMERRKRANRDMSARYEFEQLCERSGAELVAVPARNTTRECPDCGFVGENGPDLLYACPGCGVVRDKDVGACRVILARAQEALAKRGAAA